MLATQANDAAGHIQDAVPYQCVEHPVAVQKPRRLEAVSGANIRNVGLEVAHQALDDLGAQPVFGGQPVAFGRREAAGTDMVRVKAERHLVLHVACGGAADG